MKLTTFAAMAMAMLPMATAAMAWTPEGPVEIVVGTSAGGSVDRTARMLAQALKDQGLVDTPVTVVNRPGSGQALAMGYMAQHAGDPHYLVLMSPSLVTTAILNGTEKPYTEVTPVAKIFDGDLTAAVDADSDITSIADLADRLKADPTSVSFAFGTSAGNPIHIALAEFAAAAGADPIKLRTVITGASPETLAQVAGGHVDLGVASSGSIAGMADAGEIEMLGVFGKKRLPGYPDVPTFAEDGYDVVASAWYAVAAAGEISEEQAQFWSDAFATITESDIMQTQAEQNNWTLDLISGPTDVTGFLDAQWVSQTKALKGLGLID